MKSRIGCAARMGGQNGVSQNGVRLYNKVKIFTEKKNISNINEKTWNDFIIY